MTTAITFLNWALICGAALLVLELAGGGTLIACGLAYVLTAPRRKASQRQAREMRQPRAQVAPQPTYQACPYCGSRILVTEQACPACGGPVGGGK